MVDVNVRPDTDAAAAELSSAFGAEREILRLPEVLGEGEPVEMLATGVYGKGNGLMARLAGLRLRERWESWTRAPFTSESGGHVSVWEKPAR